MSRFTLSAVPVNRLQNEMGRVMNQFIHDFGGVGTFCGVADATPALNIWEEQDAFFIEAELPGLSAADLDITVKGSEVTITGERKPNYPKNANVFRQERTFGKFERMLKLPVSVANDEVSANFADGILTLRLPKSPEARPRRITVNQA